MTEIMTFLIAATMVGSTTAVFWTVGASSKEISLSNMFFVFVGLNSFWILILSILFKIGVDS